MSDAENFLSRWARRKREAVKTGDADAPPSAEASSPGGDERRSTEEARTQSPQAGSGDRQPAGSLQTDATAFDLADLPDIESISAETDISVFFQAGVPEDLKRAALRRAWATDPKIWNYIERADYDWDFNDPVAMPGFGPLQMTESLRQEVARLLGETLGSDRPPLPATAAPQPREMAQEIQPMAAAANSNCRSAQVESAAPTKESQVGEVQPAVQENHTALQQEPAPVENLQSSARRRHGRALPE